MSFSTNDDFANRELSTNELDTISAGFRITFPFNPIPPRLPVPQSVPSHGQGGDVDRPHPGEPTLSLF
jgi:hypothetical protein